VQALSAQRTQAKICQLNSDKRGQELGISALKLGFALQLVCFGMFVVVSTRFLLVSRRWIRRVLRYSAPAGASRSQLNWAVNIATPAITVSPIVLRQVSP
jgi:hypothetical protein